MLETTNLSTDPSNHNDLPVGWLKVIGIALVAIASYATGIIGS